MSRENRPDGVGEVVESGGTQIAGARILVIEDEANIRLGIEINLKANGYQVLSASDGLSGLKLARTSAPNLVILDLRLPGMHGFDVLKALRKDGFDSPVIILSAIGTETDKVAGLRLGADDYITKPFSINELLARVEAVLRRWQGISTAAGSLSFADVEVDLVSSKVTRAGKVVHLTPKEYDLLEILVRTPNRVHSREELLARVWGRYYEGTARTVDNFVVNLRKKLDPTPSRPTHLVTVRGKGYRFDP